MRVRVDYPRQKSNAHLRGWMRTKMRFLGLQIEGCLMLRSSSSLRSATVTKVRRRTLGPIYRQFPA